MGSLQFSLSSHDRIQISREQCPAEKMELLPKGPITKETWIGMNMEANMKSVVRFAWHDQAVLDMRLDYL